MEFTYIVVKGTNPESVIGTAKTIEEALFIRGPISKDTHFPNQIYKLIETEVRGLESSNKETKE